MPMAGPSFVVARRQQKPNHSSPSKSFTCSLGFAVQFANSVKLLSINGSNGGPSCISCIRMGQVKPIRDLRAYNSLHTKLVNQGLGEGTQMANDSMARLAKMMGHDTHSFDKDGRHVAAVPRDECDQPNVSLLLHSHSFIHSLILHHIHPFTHSFIWFNVVQTCSLPQQTKLPLFLTQCNSFISVQLERDCLSISERTTVIFAHYCHWSHTHTHTHTNTFTYSHKF